MDRNYTTASPPLNQCSPSRFSAGGEFSGSECALITNMKSKPPGKVRGFVELRNSDRPLEVASHAWQSNTGLLRNLQYRVNHPADICAFDRYSVSAIPFNKSSGALLAVVQQ